MRQNVVDATPMLSRLFLYYNERSLEGTTSSDSGASIKDDFKAMNRWGVCNESSWPYVIDQFTVEPSAPCFAAAKKDEVIQYQSVPQSLQAMKACLAQGYPIVIGFSVYESFESSAVAQSGVADLPTSGERCLGGHAVLVVGYDDTSQRFLLQNSWGPDWGMQGFFTLPYSYLTNPDLASDFWTIRLLTPEIQ